MYRRFCIKTSLHQNQRDTSYGAVECFHGKSVNTYWLSAKYLSYRSNPRHFYRFTWTEYVRDCAQSKLTDALTNDNKLCYVQLFHFARDAVFSRREVDGAESKASRSIESKKAVHLDTRFFIMPDTRAGAGKREREREFASQRVYIGNTKARCNIFWGKEASLVENRRRVEAVPPLFRNRSVLQKFCWEVGMRYNRV